MSLSRDGVDSCSAESFRATRFDHNLKARSFLLRESFEECLGFLHAVRDMYEDQLNNYKTRDLARDLRMVRRQNDIVNSIVQVETYYETINLRLVCTRQRIWIESRFTDRDTSLEVVADSIQGLNGRLKWGGVP
jgi:hypothetical protein